MDEVQAVAGAPRGAIGISDLDLAARIGRVDAGQHLDQGRLPGTVLADDGQDLARVNLQRDIVQCPGGSEALREAADLQEGGAPTAGVSSAYLARGHRTLNRVATLG